MKKLLAIVLSLCLLVGAMGVMSVSAASYSGTPTLSDFSGTAAGFYFDSMDGLTPPADGTGGWVTNFFGVDDTAGVFLNGTKTSVPIRKVNTNSWYVCLDNTLTLTAGDIVTVKGTVAQATDSTVQVTLQETNFAYDGTNFSDYYHYTGSPYMHHNDSAAGFYFTAGDAAPVTGWGSQWLAVSGKGSVTRNGNAISIDIRKVEASQPQQWYVVLSDYGVVPSTGDVFTVAGTFNNSNSGERIRFSSMSVTWTGSEYRNDYTGAPQYKRDDGNGNGVYFSAGDAAPVTGWGTNWDPVSGGVYKNDTLTTTAIRKVDNDEWYILLSDFGQAAVAGDIITINGTFKYLTNYITFSEAKFIFNGSSWSAYTDPSTAVGTTTTLDSSSSAAGFQIASDDGLAAPGWGTYFYAADGNDNGFFLNGTKLNVHAQKHSATLWYVDVSFANTAVNTGDIGVLKGVFVAESDSSKKVSFAEITLQYNGTAWEVYAPDTTCYGTITTLDSSSSAAGFQIASDDGLAAPGWGTYFYAADGNDNGFFLNGTKLNVHAQKHSATLWYVDVSFANTAVNTGDIGVLKGVFVAESDSNKKVSFAEIKLQYNGTAWQVYVPDPTCYGTTTTLNSSNGTSGVYLNSDDGMAAPGWGTYFYAVEGEDNGFFINGTKYNVNLQKTESNVWYVDIAFANPTLKIGDKAVIKGVFAAETDANKRASFAELTLIYTGSAWVDFTPTEVDASGISYIDTRYNTSDWGVYLIIEGTLPGDSTTYFNNVVYEVNGTPYTALAFYAAADRLYIPIQNVPAVPTEEYSVVIKGGIYEGLTAGTNAKIGAGIYLTEDFGFGIGTDYTGSSPAVNYLEGTSNGGVHLLRTDDAPVTGWAGTGNLIPVDENSGVYVDGVRNADIALRKYEDGKYYVCMSDIGVIATEGTIITVKGSFTLNNLYTVTFPTSKYTYVNSAWKVYVASAGSDEISTGILGNANSDSTFDISDAVTAIRFVAGVTDDICMIDADINGSGTVDRDDIRLIRRMLLGDLLYHGEPLYEDEEEMRLLAYAGPRHTDGSPITAADNALFADYAAAGFTTLVSEHDGILENDEFATYMSLAAQNDLDVIVFSGAMVNMLRGEIDYNQALLTESIRKAAAYDNFRGFMMADEPWYSYADNYRSVSSVIKQLTPGAELFSSCLPIWTEVGMPDDSSLSATEAYTLYTQTYGEILGDYTYDFYPFLHRYSSFAGFEYNHRDAMRPGYFQNMEIVADAGKGRFETGLTVQAYAEYGENKEYYRAVAQNDISYQVYSGLAYGMKTINYFTYTNHWAIDDCYQSMIFDGVKQQLYYDVQAVNSEIKKFDHVMLDFNWQGTIGITGDNEDGVMDYVGNYSSSRISAYSASNDAIIGCLKDHNAYDGFMLVNATDPIDEKSVDVSVTFNDATHAKVFVNGVESIVALTDGVYAATLAPGQGIFVIPYIAE